MNVAASGSTESRPTKYVRQGTAIDSESFRELTPIAYISWSMAQTPGVIWHSEILSSRDMSSVESTYWFISV